MDATKHFAMLGSLGDLPEAVKACARRRRSEASSSLFDHLGTPFGYRSLVSMNSVCGKD
jgi:hypothetical protein